MFEVFIDKWEKNIDRGTSFKLNDKEIQKLLSQLDGKTYTQILLVQSNKKSSLLIGGGNNTHYVCTYTVGNDEDFYNLINPKKSGTSEIELVTGGQAGLFLDKYVVDFNAVLEAVNYYIKTSLMSEKLIWEKQV